MIFSRLDSGGENDLEHVRCDMARKYLTRVYATSPFDMQAFNVFDTIVEFSIATDMILRIFHLKKDVLCKIQYILQHQLLFLILYLMMKIKAQNVMFQIHCTSFK